MPGGKGRGEAAWASTLEQRGPHRGQWRVDESMSFIGREFLFRPEPRRAGERSFLWPLALSGSLTLLIILKPA